MVAPCVQSWLTFVLSCIAMLTISLGVFLTLNYFTEPIVMRDCIQYVQAMLKR